MNANRGIKATLFGLSIVCYALLVIGFFLPVTHVITVDGVEPINSIDLFKILGEYFSNLTSSSSPSLFFSLTNIGLAYLIPGLMGVFTVIGLGTGIYKGIKSLLDDQVNPTYGLLLLSTGIAVWNVAYLRGGIRPNAWTTYGPFEAGCVLFIVAGILALCINATSEICFQKKGNVRGKIASVLRHGVGAAMIILAINCYISTYGVKDTPNTYFPQPWASFGAGETFLASKSDAVKGYVLFFISLILNILSVIPAVFLPMITFDRRKGMSKNTNVNGIVQSILVLVMFAACFFGTIAIIGDNLILAEGAYQILITLGVAPIVYIVCLFLDKKSSQKSDSK